jgi:DNA-binding GntR family transcriptional regulator
MSHDPGAAAPLTSLSGPTGGSPSAAPAGSSEAQDRRIESPPSLVELGAQMLRRMIIAGELPPGARVVETQLTQVLGISRPPLREALRLLEREGLIQQTPRKGARVIPLTLHDVYEIVTLRQELEQLAIELGVPVRDATRLARCREALSAMHADALRDDAPALAEHGFGFHLSVVGLSGHKRLEEAYRSLQLQMLLCFGLNLRAREKRAETLEQDVERHHTLFAAIESGERDRVRDLLSHHGDLSFLYDLDQSFVDQGSPEAKAWLRRVRATGDRA